MTSRKEAKMSKIKNRDEVLERIKKLYRKQNYRLSCEFCAGSSYNFAVAPFLVQNVAKHSTQQSLMIKAQKGE